MNTEKQPDDNERAQKNGHAGMDPREGLHDENAPKPLKRAAQILRELANKPNQRTYSTGFDALDDLTAGGFKSRQLTVIGGATGGGKTSFLGSIVAHWLKEGTPVLWAHTEIPEDEQAARLAAILLYASDGTLGTPDAILTGKFDLELAAQSLDGLPFFMIDLDDLADDADPLKWIEGMVKSIHAETGKLPIVIVDYLQELAIEDAEQRRMSVTKVTKKLRRTAQRLDVAMVGISSVGRNFYPGKKISSDEEEDPILWLATAKESGDIEYNAAVYAFLETDRDCNAIGESAARLIVAKSRRGMRGKVGLRFHGPSGLFTPSAESLKTMGPERKREKDREAVIKVVTAKKYKPLTKTNLGKKCGINPARARDAIQSLIDNETFKTIPNPENKRSRLVVHSSYQEVQREMTDEKPEAQAKSKKKSEQTEMAQMGAEEK
jgi:replicative DNA helicase